jgi:hypothetical protein
MARLMAFNLIPGLVIRGPIEADMQRHPQIVCKIARDPENEVVTALCNSALGDQWLAWDYCKKIEVLGTAVELDPDNLYLFDRD